jgi:hypothetical protein
MSEETTRNFLNVLQSFEWPEPMPVTYRLYHDEQGRPLIYTMEALPGTYIEVDQATYVKASYHVMVRDNKLIVLQPKTSVSRLVSDPEVGTPCDFRDVCVVVDPSRQHKKWTKQTNDIS